MLADLHVGNRRKGVQGVTYFVLDIILGPTVLAKTVGPKCVYNYCVQSCVFYASIPVPSICNQSIPIDTNLSIDWY